MASKHFIENRVNLPNLFSSPAVHGSDLDITFGTHDSLLQDRIYSSLTKKRHRFVDCSRLLICKSGCRNEESLASLPINEFVIHEILLEFNLFLDQLQAAFTTHFLVLLLVLFLQFQQA